MAPMLNQKRCIWIEGMNGEHAPRFACRREDAWITHPRGDPDYWRHQGGTRTKQWALSRSLPDMNLADVEYDANGGTAIMRRPSFSVHVHDESRAVIFEDSNLVYVPCSSCTYALMMLQVACDGFWKEFDSHSI